MQCTRLLIVTVSTHIHVQTPKLSFSSRCSWGLKKMVTLKKDLFPLPLCIALCGVAWREVAYRDADSVSISLATQHAAVMEMVTIE